MKRILLLVTVALVMAATMVAMAKPILADSPWTDVQGTCTIKQGKPELVHSRDTNKDKTKCFVNPEQFKHRQRSHLSVVAPHGPGSNSPGSFYALWSSQLLTAVYSGGLIRYAEIDY